MERRVGEVRRDGGEGWWRGGGRGVHIMSLRCRSSTAATAGKAFFSRAFAQASRPPPYTPASLRPFLDRQGTVILDGGLGTALGAESEQDALWGAQHLFRLEGHNKLLDLHRAFLEAGSDVISSASYQVEIDRLVPGCEGPGIAVLCSVRVGSA